MSHSQSSPEDPNLFHRVRKLEARRVNLRYWMAVSEDEIIREQCRNLLLDTEAELDRLCNTPE
jgi:hypothetical protein